MSYGTLIQTQTVSSAVAAVTFSSIPQVYTDLLLVISTRSTQTGQSYADTLLTFNGTSTTYASRWLQGSGSVTASSGSTVGPDLLMDGSTAVANTFGNGLVYIPNYTGSANKLASFDGVMEDNATLSYQRFGASLWSNTAAITSITCTDSATYVAGSSFSLYGIK